MASDERATRVSERCAAHPGRAAVAECEACGQPLCVACAVPVRGGIVGVECLAAVVGERSVADPGRTWTAAELASGVGLALAAIASILPWTRFGVGSGLFGGWDAVPSWSLLASVAGVLGTAIWWAVLRRGQRGAALAAAAGGAVAAIAASLAAVHPPPFTKPSIGPALAVVGGLIAVGGVAAATREARHVG